MLGAPGRPDRSEPSLTSPYGMEVTVRLHRLIIGIAPLVMLGCEGALPAEPELSPGLEPILAEGYYGDCCGCEQPAEGRMTGGGVVRLVGDVKITHGFTLHCDQKLSNNLEVNWLGNKWHINPKGVLSNVSCTDDPAVEPDPPPAPFDTFCGTATGDYNGQSGYWIDFCLQDAGEPGGKNDRASMTIQGPDGIVLAIGEDFIVSGNLQAHYDQPHKK